MRHWTTVLLLGMCAIHVSAQKSDLHQRIDTPDPWYSTFSIIAYDPETNELGVAVQSRAFASGAAVPFAEAGIGAIATQASTNRQYGPQAIAMLKQGLSPEEIVKRITDADPIRDTRQVAVIDFKGHTAAFTGKTTLTHVFAGSIAGKNYSVQGNTLAGEAVVKAMAHAYETSKGSMAERFMDVLDAGQSQGGDRRGMQSAGILVVRPLTPGSLNTNERIVDIRVDDAVDPFKELRRLLNLTLSRDLQMESTQLQKDGKLAEAITLATRSAQMNPHGEQVRYLLAQECAQSSQKMQAYAWLHEAIELKDSLKVQAASDAAFEKMRDDAEFKKLISTSGETR